MGKTDIKMNRWLSDNERFAGFVNGILFGGENVISKEELEDEKTEKKWIVKDKNGGEKAIQRYRDIENRVMDGTRIVILACENQDKVHYGMVIRNMLYDSLDYAEQIYTKKKAYKENKEWGNQEEFLSGLRKEDLLNPVITIVFYYGEKEWDGQTTLHGLTGVKSSRYQRFQKYVPNYHINVVTPADLEGISCPNRDLQMLFGMLRYRKDKEELQRYFEKNADYFSDMDEETYDAAVVMLGKEQILKNQRREKEDKRDMCKALDDLYHDGVMEGKKAGISEGRAGAIVELLGKNESVPERMRNVIFAQKDMDVLREWLWIAAGADNLQEFEQRTGIGMAG